MKRVLIIDEEPAVRTALARFLSDSGFAVRTVGDLEDASGLIVPTAEGPGVDVALFDVSPGHVDPSAAIERLREVAEAPLLPLVLILDDRAPDLALAGVITLRKPVRLEALRNTIYELLQRGIA